MDMLKDLMKDRPIFGTFVKLPRPEVVEVLALAGYDFVVCDGEHAQMDESDIQSVVRAARGVGLPIVVRTSGLERGLINRSLEAGAQGIQLPRTGITTASDFAKLLRYPPAGGRSTSTAHAMAAYGDVVLSDYQRRANDDVIAVGQFETADFATGIDDVMAALDVAFIGPVDLRVDMGHSDDPTHPDVRDACNTIRAAASRAGIATGTFVSGAAAAREAMEVGDRYIVIAGDITMLQSGARRLLEETRNG